MSAFPCSLRTACALAALLASAAARADGTPVHIELDGSQGKGVAVMRGIDCYVVTAAHVLRRPVGIFVVGAQRRRTEADIFANLSNRGWDVAVLKVREPAQVCRSDYYIPSDRLDKLLQTGVAATLRLRGEAGNESALPVSIVGWDEKEVQLRGPAGALHQSLSGSVVYIGEQRVAMLVTVPAGGPEPARAIRFDRISELTSNYLRLDPPTEEQARADDQIGMERLRANMNFVESAKFCDSIYRVARWIYEREPKLEFRERRSGIMPVYIIDSLVVPTVDSELTFSGKEARISTNLTRVPLTVDVKPYWDRTIRAVDKCARATRDQKNLSLRNAQRDIVNSKVWDLAYESDWGMWKSTISIWLDFTGTYIEMRMLGNN